MHPQSQAALEHIRATIGSDRKVVFVSGNFNIVHPGHLRLLKHARECGDALIVGVNSQETPGNVISEELRLEGVRAIGLVSYAFILRDPPSDFVDALKPAVVVKGKEHEREFNPEQEVLDRYGGHLLFSSGEVVFSSFDLMRREFKELNSSSIVKPLDFPRRRGFGLRELKQVLAKFAGMRVLVLGDLIVDEYIACEPLGMSEEDPTIVVTPLLTQRFVGGAGIVSGHASGLGADVTFISVTGQDETADYAAEKLASYGIDVRLFQDETRPTTLKQRYRAAGKTLLRVSRLKHHQIDLPLQERMLDAVTAAIRKLDLVVFSDFNYGSLPQQLVDLVVALCREHKVPMVADSQSSSQVGDVSRFKHMLLLKPTEREARLAVRDFNSGLVIVADAIRDKADASHIIITLGAEGLLINASPDEPGEQLTTDRLPAFNLAPKDTAGAGDSLLITSSLALVAGAGIWRSAYLGSLAAACQVGRIGNTPVTARDITIEIES